MFELRNSESVEPSAITEADVIAVIQKLDDWASELPNDERELFQLMLARAEGCPPSDLQGQEYRTPEVPVLIDRVLERIGEYKNDVDGQPMLAKPRPWVKGGPAWVKGAD